ncbi:MAG TPA: RidA family protein [bacterium]|nr:RidA family protein [bacterium]
MNWRIVNPKSLPEPHGWNHGLLAPAKGRLLFVAGQIGVEANVEASPFVDQFDAALSNVLAVVRAAGGQPEHVARMTVYITDMNVYRANPRALKERWQKHMGRYYPTMTLVEVKSLVEKYAQVEIEATAVIPESS